MDDCKQFDILSVTTTVSSRSDAGGMARAALAAGVAACVQIEPIDSVYRWEGKLCEEPEHRVTFKTALDAQASLEAWLRQNHPYQLPQIISSRCLASEPYFDWVQARLRESA